jgi:hypothetical protein
MRKEIFAEIKKWNAQNRKKYARSLFILMLITALTGIIVFVNGLGISFGSLAGSFLITVICVGGYIGFMSGVIENGSMNIPDDLLIVIATSKNVDNRLKKALGGHLKAHDGIITFNELYGLVSDLDQRKGTLDRISKPGVAALIQFSKGEDS